MKGSNKFWYGITGIIYLFIWWYIRDYASFSPFIILDSIVGTQYSFFDLMYGVLFFFWILLHWIIAIMFIISGMAYLYEKGLPKFNNWLDKVL